MLPTTQFVYGKGLGTCDAHFRAPLSHTAKRVEKRTEGRIVLINFRVAFHRVNHQGILCKLCYVGIGGSVLSILTQ